MSLITGSASSIGRTFLNEESSLKKKGIVAACSIAASFFAGALYLNTYFSAVFSAKSLFMVLGSNLAGQAIMSLFVQTVLFDPFRSIETLISLNNDQLQDLCKKYEADAEAFKRLSPLMQQLFYYQSCMVNMRLSHVPAQPSEDDMAALSYEEILSLYDLKDFVFTENGPGMQKLLLRFFNYNLNYHSAFNTFLKDLPLVMPKNARQIERWSPEHKVWYKAFFKENPHAQSLLNVNLQRKLYIYRIVSHCRTKEGNIENAIPLEIRESHKKCQDYSKWISYTFEEQKSLKARFDEYNLEHDFPLHPQTADEVNELSETRLFVYHEKYELSLFSEEVHKAFLKRFFDLDKDPPDTRSFRAWTSAQLESYAMLEVPLPKTKDELYSLEENQKQWIFPIALKSPEWKDLSFPMQVLIFRKCFNTHSKFTIEFTLPTYKEATHTYTWKKDARQLYNQLKAHPEVWKSLPILLQWKLNTQHFHGNEVPAIPYQFDPTAFKEVPEKHIRLYYDLFKKEKALWSQLSFEQQMLLNNTFDFRGKLPYTINPADLTEVPKTHLEEYHALFEKETELWEQLSYEQQIGFNIAFGRGRTLQLKSAPTWGIWAWGFRARYSPL